MAELLRTEALTKHYAVGFWRPRPMDKADADEHIPLEVLISHPTGFLEAMLGEIRGPRIEIATQVVIRDSQVIYGMGSQFGNQTALYLKSMILN